MATIVKNNLPAKSTLNELNRNSKALSKTLRQVSTGMRINGAQDDASGFSIAEKMRAKLRGLEQDVQNVKTGRSMLGVAAGGIESIVEELRNLKEIALNAANDHNSDLDRATLQREFDQKTANIDEIASTTNYNGKLLLDGTYRRWQLVPYQPLEPNDPATVIPMGNYTISAGGVYEIPPGYSGTITIASGIQDVKIRQQTSAQLSGVYIEGPSGGNANLWIENLNIENSLNSPETPVIKFSGSGNYLSLKGNNTLKKTGSATLGFDEPVIHVGNGLTLTGSGHLSAHLKGVHSCSLIGTRDSESSTADIIVLSGAYDLSVSSNIPGVNDNGSCIGGGWGGGSIGNIVIYGGDINAVSESGAAIGSDNGNATAGNIYIGGKASITSHSRDGAGIGSGSSNSSVGDITISRKSSVHASSTNGEGIGRGVNSSAGDIIYVDDLGLEELSDYIETELVHGRPLVIHHGTEAGEAVNFYINDMHTWSLGIDEVRVITRDDATAAIAAIEDALEYALEEATYVGSYSSRLGLTEENLVTANENTQSGESTIRDADMARTMLEYTKNSILSQASQSMLAQANQNLSGVLSLLQ